FGRMAGAREGTITLGGGRHRRGSLPSSLSERTWSPCCRKGEGSPLRWGMRRSSSSREPSLVGDSGDRGDDRECGFRRIRVNVPLIEFIFVFFICYGWNSRPFFRCINILHPFN